MALDVYIGDETLELPKTAVLAITKALIDVNKLNAIRSDNSNTISVPYTDKNRRLLEHAQYVQSNTTLPYKRIDCRVVQDSVDIIAKGYGVIDEASDAYKLTIFSGNVDWSIALEGKLLPDINFCDTIHQWSLAEVEASHVAPYNGVYVYPPIDCDNGLVSYVAPDTFRFAMLRPYVFVREIFNRIFDAIGYTIDPDIDTDPRYSNMIVECSKFGADKRWMLVSGETNTLTPCTRGTFGTGVGIQYREGYLVFPDNRVDIFDCVPALGYNVLTQDTIVLPGVGAGNENLTYLNVVKNGSIRIKIDLTIDVNQLAPLDALNPTGFVAPNTRTYKIESNIPFTLVANSVNQWTFQQTNSIEFTMDVFQGQQIKFWLRCTTTPPGSHEFIQFDILPGSKLEVTDYAPDAIMFQGDYMNVGFQLPDITQVDFVKYVAFMLGRIPYPDITTGTIYFKPWGALQDNLDSGNTLDWSNKHNDAVYPNLKYRLTGWAQSNYFKYTPDKEGGVFDGFGDSSIPVTDDWLPATREVITLPFSATMPNSDGIPYVLRSTSPYQWDREGAPRILMTRSNPGVINLEDVGTAITSVSPYFEAYFIKPGEVSLGWNNNLLNDYYGFVTLIGDNPKIVTAEISLDTADIQSFDPFVPVYLRQYGAYFFVNKINAWVKGRPCKVELIRL